MKVVEFLISDLDEYVNDNKVIEITEDGEDLHIKTSKSTLVFEQLSMNEFKRTHCSCVNIYKAHFSVLKSILKSCIIRSGFVYEL